GVVAQSSLNHAILCVPGQCLQGYSNITLGATLSSSASPVPLHLLPGQYSSTTNPELLHNVLSDSSATLKSSPGFTNGSISLPLDLSLQPGLAIFSERLYSGQTAFTALPGSPPNPNSSTPLAAQSLLLSSNVVVIASSSSSNRVILWDPLPDTQNLPTPLNTAQLSLLDIQSTTCAPSCSSGGICNQQGQCICQDGFTGQSCENCNSGRFGPSCQKCPDNCDQCDDGISGTGRCLKPSGGGNGASSCNCLNGVCGSDGNCQCNTGFVKADNGTQCAKCADGFFLTSTGDCKVCQVGCNQCSDGTGVCTSCKSGFTQNPTDQTKCIPPKQITSTGTQCPELAFANGGSCQPCASPCQSCSGGTSNDCTACVQGQYMLNGVCVTANSDGICEGTSFLADNNKKACDSCGAKCTACKISNFSIASLASQAQCTSCIPGTFLSNGTCVDACPSGTFVSPKDNMTCQSCDSSCATCLGSATFCLTCSSSNQLSSNGQCVPASSCPKNTFPNPSTSSCLSCHPDCATCSGSSFNQCTTCPPNRPVLSNGRCMPTCSKNEYWDASSNSCKTCDSSCGSCSGPGASSCLSCTNENNLVLRSGSCVASSQACTGSNNTTSVVNPLGACLSELIAVPQASGTSGLPPMPTVTGINQPTVVKGKKLEWWQILLMALGCAFIFVAVLWCCRRRNRKRREERRRRVQAYAFANTDKNGWKWRLIRFGEKFFGHSKSTRVYPVSYFHSMEMEPTARGKPIVLLSDAPPSHSRHGSDSEEQDMVQLISSYRNLKTPPATRTNFVRHGSRSGTPTPSNSSRTRLLAPSPSQSMYSQMTGHARRMPDVRQPVRDHDVPPVPMLKSKFSESSIGATDDGRRGLFEHGKLKKKRDGGGGGLFWK
ncbi:Furin-like protease 2, partial [Leucoagaricus sp. SymC.cos]